MLRKPLISKNEKVKYYFTFIKYQKEYCFESKINTSIAQKNVKLEIQQ